MTRARLIYFEMRGRAEATRLFLHATETGFDDHRVVAKGDWEALRSTLPFARLPVLETSGRMLCESHAILRHLGRILGTTEQDEARRAELDAAQEVIAELQEDLWRFNWREGYADQLESYAHETLLPRLTQLESWLARTTRTAEAAGAGLSHVDCLAYCYLDEVDAFFPAVLSAFPDLARLHRRVASMPGISDYLASDARPPVFGMGIAGPKVDPRITLTPQYRFENPWTAPLDLAPFVRRQRRLTRIDI